MTKAAIAAIAAAAACACARADEVVRAGDADPSASFRAAVARLAGSGGTVRFEPGEYRLSVSSGVDMEFFISNHDQSGSHRVVFPIVGATNLTVEAQGALFVFDGKPIPFVVMDSRNVTLRGFAVDSSVPFMPEFRITGFSDKGTLVRADPANSPYRIVDGRIRFRGADWEYEATHAKLFDGETRELVERSGDIFYKGEASEAANGELLLKYDFARRGRGAKVGDVVVLRPGVRPSPAMVVYRSEDVMLEDVAVHSSLGMALLAQRSRNVSWRGTGDPASRRSGVFPRAATGRYASAHADATHFSNVAGQAVVENCLFEGMMDDAMNVHSTCLFITNVLSGARIRCRYMHHQSVGFEVFRPGERLRFIDGDTLEPGAETTVVAVERHGAEEVTLTLDAPLPEGMGVGDAVENADWQCSATFRGNIVRFNRARGTLFTTPGRVLVESNLFDRVSGCAVLLAGDAHYWFESGACRDVLIRGNVFRNCLTAYGSHGHSFGVVSICPTVHDIAAQKRRYHGNVRIEDNLFEAFDVPLLYVFSTDGLKWRRNRVVRNALYRGQGKPPFIVESSANVDLGGEADRLSYAGRRETPLSGGGWTLDGEPVSVPHTWNAVDGADGGFNPKGTFTSCRAVSYERKAATYRRALPDPTPGKRQFVKCDGVSIKATVRVNGREAGRHKGAFTTFCIEVTDFLKPSGNVLEIVADNTLDDDVPPIVGDFTMYGGVYRDVFFVETDPVCIDFVTDGADGVDVDADPSTGEVVARVRVLGGTNETQRFSFPSPRLWSPEEPNMYSVNVRVSQKGSVDEISVPFSFRTVRFDDTGFYLNGVRRKMRGACRHQDREGKGWAVSAQDEMDDVRMMKAMGCDAVRTSHYPQSRGFLDFCDRLGLMVWCENSLVNEVTFSDAFHESMMAQAREMIAQRRNHPSIVVWGLFNEIYSGSKHKAGTIEVYLREVRDLMHAMDPSRKVVCASNQYGRRELSHVPDFCAFNVYPGWYNMRPWYWRSLDRDGTMMEGLLKTLMATNALPSVGIGEYGAGGSVKRHLDPFEQTTYSDNNDAEEYQAFFHYANYRAIRDCDRVWGSFIWEMFDSGSDRQNEPGRPGCNTKGLVEFDHKTPKDAFYFYKANWNPEPMLHLVGARRTHTTNAVNSVFAFCNAGRVSLSVNGAPVGEREPDDRKAVIWDGVRLAPGTNVIEVRSGPLSASCRLRLD